MTDSRHALIIANDRYADQGLRKLKAPAQDATALAGVLHDAQIGDFEVEVVSNASADTMRRHIQRFFNDRRRDDTLLLHFSCHGLKSESGELYFAASDTEPRLLDATAVPAQFVRGCMSRTKAGRTVLFLDCCYGGAFSRGSTSVRAAGDVNVLESFTTERPVSGRGWAVITASDSMEYAFEGEELAGNSAPRPSVFTHAVVRGLGTGEADLDADGEVSFDDLYEYVYEQVREQNPNQTPKKTVEMRGDLRLAHSRRGRIKIAAVPTPASLRAALDSDNVLTRQGAVLELENRLRDESLPVAEGARQALVEVAGNDIRQIAALAHRALREIRLAPSPDRLDFGLVPKGSPCQEQTVTMNGPPLAGHCVAQPTEPWLRVDPTADGLEVRVDTAAEGHLSGDIALKGVADEAVIHVEAVVGPAHEPAPPTGPASETPPGTTPRQREPGQGVHDRETAIIESPPSPPSPPHSHKPPPARHLAHEPPSSPSPARKPPTAAPPSREPEPPASPPPRTSTAPPRDANRPRLAPALAGAALALAVGAVVTLVMAVRAAAVAIAERSDQGVGGSIEDKIREQGALAPLTVSLITAALALVVGAFARHDLGRRRERYSPRAASGTRTLTSVAKGVAIPVLVLAVLMGIAYLVGSAHW
ncbi:caspase family protein [Streptomyces sp. NRRL S-481]|uniref:caspase family protein n=1 Tax=Streptomyces sp. NRRL S-481 TaxID=1463911 RepID=UPI0006907814|nr:caspase family protein [Streptomyces sp. NRRL S-481]